MYTKNYLHYQLNEFVIRDKEGRYIIFWNMSKFDVDKCPEPDLMRALVYALERATEGYLLFNFFLYTHTY